MISKTRQYRVPKLNGRGQTAGFQYDAAGRLTSLNDSAGTVSYTYDANGNVLTVTDLSGTITRQYDALNRVKKYTDAGGNVIQYDYDTVGNRVPKLLSYCMTYWLLR